MSALKAERKRQRRQDARGAKVPMIEPCKRGRLGLKYVAGDGCVECNQLRQRAYRKASKEKMRVVQRANYLKHAYSITASNATPCSTVRVFLCRICGVGLDEKRHTHVDHDYQTDEVREILCGNCNWMSGCAMDSPALLRRAADYLEGFD